MKRVNSGVTQLMKLNREQQEQSGEKHPQDQEIMKAEIIMKTGMIRRTFFLLRVAEQNEKNQCCN